MHCKSISKSFQNIIDAFSNIDNALNETAELFLILHFHSLRKICLTDYYFTLHEC